MSNLDVSMRLRLVNDLSKEAGKAERDLKDLADAARRLGNTGGGDKLGDSIRRMTRDTEQLDRKMRNVGIFPHVSGKLNQVNGSAGTLNRTLGSLGSVATSAFASIMAFASVDSIIQGLERLSQQYQKLNRDVASVAVTAEMRTPQAMERISKSNERLSIRYGNNQLDVNKARKAYAAAGVDIDSQESILDPTLKSAKAADSNGETIAGAVIAAKQNLGVKDSEVPAALDMMAKGAKLGSFEVDAMAKNFPSLGTMLAGTGRQGLGGWAELIALAQVVRTGAASPDDAATNLRNLLSKVTSKDTVKNFDEKGVDLSKLKAKSERDGTPYLTAVMDEVMRLTGGDEFKINELFGDQQAGLALKPLLTKRSMYEDFLKQILTGSAGTVDADYDFLRALPQEKTDRRGAAMAATGDKIGRVYSTVTDPLRDATAGVVNPEYAAQEEAYRKEQLRKLGPVELSRRISEMQKKLSALPSELFDPLSPALAATRGAGRAGMQELQDILSRLDGGSSLEARDERAAGAGKGGGWRKFLLGKGADADFNLREHLGIDLKATAEQSMQGYNEGLAAEGERAAQEAQSIADRIKSMLGFTVSPVIAPTFVPPSGAPAASGQQSSIQPMSNKTTNYITSPNPQHAALKASRAQARAIQQAQARSLADTGRRFA